MKPWTVERAKNNQIWASIAPNPSTGKEFINLAAKEFGVAPKYRVLSRPMIRIAVLFDPLLRESYEMLYPERFPNWAFVGRPARANRRVPSAI